MLELNTARGRTIGRVSGWVKTMLFDSQTHRLVEVAPETFMVVIIVDIVTRVARDYGAVD